MLRGPFGHMRRNIVAYLALFVALGGTSAYAANEWTGANIIDESLTGADIKNGAVSGGEVTNESLTTADIKNFSLGNGDFLTGSVDSRAATDNSLTGTDINESTLNMPPTTTATFAGRGNVPVAVDGAFTKVTSKSLPAGSYAIAATATVQMDTPAVLKTYYLDTGCELRDTNGAFIGGGRDRRNWPTGQITIVSVSMNGGVQVPAGGGEVGLYCRLQAGAPYSRTADGQMMIIRVDGFS